LKQSLLYPHEPEPKHYHAEYLRMKLLREKIGLAIFSVKFDAIFQTEVALSRSA
jgi:hypothetical protein